MDSMVPKKDAPKQKTYIAVTKPHWKEQILAIQKASTAGQMFFTTGGRHLNANEFFQADILKSREAEIKEMEDLKKAKRVLYYSATGYCLDPETGELTWKTHKQFKVNNIRMLLKWKKL
jgi:hypothetical protein